VEFPGKNQDFYPSKTPFLFTFSVYCVVSFFKGDYARNRTDERFVGGDSICQNRKMASRQSHPRNWKTQKRKRRVKMSRKDFGAKPYLYPQLVAIVGTYSEDNTPDAMNAAWGGVAGSDKVFLCLSKHKTTDNIERTGEFTVSVADAAHLVEADYLGIASAYDVPDKVERAGLHVIKSKFVNAPIFEEFPIALECKLIDKTPYGVVGQIVNVSIDERVLTAEGIVDPEKLQAISYDSVSQGYLKVGGRIGNAFSDGKKLGN
jgi:flavin reductase (DIM6/NTAB) family NADH-FMN oxidoreductase RutF